MRGGVVRNRLAAWSRMSDGLCECSRPTSCNQMMTPYGASRTSTTVRNSSSQSSIKLLRTLHNPCRGVAYPYTSSKSVRANNLRRYRGGWYTSITACTYSQFSSAAIQDDFDEEQMSFSNSYEKRPGDESFGKESRHCKTCTCPETKNKEESIHGTDLTSRTSHEMQLQKNSNNHQDYIRERHQLGIHQQNQQAVSPNTCLQPVPLVPPNTPLPKPLPKPNYSFKRRALPPNLIAFNSTEGKHRFLKSLQSNNAEAYFPLSQQFLNQMDPAYCGVSTLVLVLNALAIDPNVRWRGGWRWYGDESMLLERCCLEEERVAREGITLEQYCGLARCQGVELAMKRPIHLESGNEQMKIKHTEGRYGLEEFRRDIIRAVQHPPASDQQTTEETRDKSERQCFLVSSFARSALQQTGDGHFSPIAAYHADTDSCLVMDVARFKYAPYWVDVKDLYDAMIPLDKATGKSRGWILMYPPSNAFYGTSKDTNEPLSKEELEGKRPAACVPLAGTGDSICPVEKIKVEFCSVK